MVKVSKNKRKRFVLFAKEVAEFVRQKWKEFWHPKQDIEVNEQIKKMSSFVTNSYHPKEQAKIIKGLKTGVLTYLNAEAIAAEKRAKDCREAIVIISKT